MSEHDEQKALIDWATQHEKQFPLLALLHAIPNGGKRNIVVAKKLKQEGVKPGVPDLFLPCPVDPWHGLYIEMKYGKNKLTANQKWWAGQLKDMGYQYRTCWSWVEAAKEICTYLGYTTLRNNL